MFKRILIANRGEIAMRIIRACRELGIRTVAIYAECDATAIFVKKADEAHRIGPDPVQGFLDMQAIVDLAKRSGADRKSTRLNSSHSQISYAVFCLKKKKRMIEHQQLVIAVP